MISRQAALADVARGVHDVLAGLRLAPAVELLDGRTDHRLVVLDLDDHRAVGFDRDGVGGQGALHVHVEAHVLQRHIVDPLHDGDHDDAAAGDDLGLPQACDDRRLIRRNLLPGRQDTDQDQNHGRRHNSDCNQILHTRYLPYDSCLSSSGAAIHTILSGSTSTTVTACPTGIRAIPSAGRAS